MATPFPKSIRRINAQFQLNTNFSASIADQSVLFTRGIEGDMICGCVDLSSGLTQKLLYAEMKRLRQLILRFEIEITIKDNCNRDCH